MFRKTTHIILVLGLTLTGWAVFSNQSVYANTLIVTTNNDGGAGSLRQASDDASSGGDSVRIFDVGNGVPSVNINALDLVDGYNDNIPGGAAAIYHPPGTALTIENSNVTGNDADATYSGGGIINIGDLTIRDSTFST